MKDFEGVDARTLSDADFAQLDRQLTAGEATPRASFQITVDARAMSERDFALLDQAVRDPGSVDPAVLAMLGQNGTAKA